MSEFLLASAMNPVFTDEEAAQGAALLGLGILAVFLIILGIFFFIKIAICFMLMRIQEGVPREHQQMAPGMAFILLIPVIDSLLAFYVYNKIPASYTQAFGAAGQPIDDSFTKLGLWVAICWVVATFGQAIPVVGCFSGAAGLAALVLMIMFIMKGFELKGRLESMSAGAPPVAHA